MNREKCHDCGALEGELHGFGCDMERCPFCGGQLISCSCRYKQLGLYDPQKYGPHTYHTPLRVYNNGLSEEEEEKWQRILSVHGRVPWIKYPTICAKCGMVDPPLFSVPDEEWEKYVEPGKRRRVLCQECYDFIKHVIDQAQEAVA